MHWKNDYGHGEPETNIIQARDAIYICTSHSVCSLSYNGDVNWEQKKGGYINQGIGGLGLKLFVTESTEKGGAVHSLDRTTGDVLWTQDNLNSSTEPVVGTDSVYVIEKDGVVHSLDQGNGSVVWSTDIRGDETYAAPALNQSKNHLYIPSGSTGNLVALDSTTGTKQWHLDVGSSANHEVVHDGQRLYHPGKNIRIIDTDDGTIYWETNNYAGSGKAAISGKAVWINGNGSLLRMGPTNIS